MDEPDPKTGRTSRDLVPGNPGADPLPWPAADSDPADRATDQAVMDELRAVETTGKRSSLRDTIGLLVTKLTAAEREMRSADEAAAAGRLAGSAVGGEGEKRVFSAFKAGFFGGVGLLLAYMAYLSLDTIRSTLIVIAVAALLAIGLNPAVGWLVRRGLRRGAAVATVFLVLVAAIAGAVYAIVPPIVTQLTAFIGNLPSILSNLLDNPTIKNLDAKFGIIKQLQDSDIVKNVGSGAASGILSGAATVAGIVFDLFVVLILTLYFLAGFPQIKAACYRLAPASQRVRVTDLGDKILKQMGGYLSGATIIAIQAGLVAGLFSAIVGLPYPWAIALGAAVLDFVPVVGPIIVGVSIALIGFTQSLTIGIVAAAFYLCQHLFEAYVLYPRVMRRTVHISSGAVIVAILVGGALLGVTGALLAVPVAAGVQLIVREVVMPIQEGR
ncbi:AI-2E family transporter [Nakamurella lactea]|uniref:AI-2E family transporter n=1 Tax=Nakamurella lactea TaxID=459515 RepID=UPI00068795D6|nr:AI-2E family transporter [Nakamurella lactea]